MSGYQKTRPAPLRLYLIRHAEHGETTANGHNKRDAIIAAARKWGVRWTSIARECEVIVLAEEERDNEA